MNNEQQTNNSQENERFESDARKLANKHLSDPNHVITDEDLQKVQVGMTPPRSETLQQAIEDAEDRIADTKSNKEDDTIPGAQKVTPWDVVE